MVKRSQYVVSMGRASVASAPRAGFLDALAFLGFLVLEEYLIYRIDIREGGGKLNAFIIFHEIQAVSPSPPAASYDENFFISTNAPVVQGGYTSGGIFSRPPSTESLEYFFFGLFAQFQGPLLPLGVYRMLNHDIYGPDIIAIFWRLVSNHSHFCLLSGSCRSPPRRY
ncbi:hypothetical protein V7R84_08155 [Arachnia propionica]|uniref:hypothetical protein n=1 Tax=Arachnia propionica TaxID=1750 RepID=UPI0030CE373B